MSEPAQQYQKTPEKFSSINNLKEDVLALSSISKGFHSRIIVLRNLRTDETIKEWSVEYSFAKNDRVFAPLMLNDSTVILNVSEKTMLKIDKEGRVLWQLEKPMATHHSVNIDGEKNIWTLGKYVDNNDNTLLTHKYDSQNGRELHYADEFILKIDSETGKILYKKSLTEIFLENEMEHELKKAQFVEGPFHANDVEPALFSSNYFQKGDLFISLRNMSMILQFNPTTNKVIRTISGEFIFQHDVDIVDSTTISIFNNNTINEIENTRDNRTKHKNITVLSNGNSNMIFYNLRTNEITFPFKKQFSDNAVFTHYEGLIRWLDKNTILVEEQEKGVLWIFDSTGVIYKNIHRAEKEGYHHMMNWTRIVEK